MKRLMFVVVVVGLAYASVAYGAASQIKVDDDFFAPRTAPVRNVVAGASFQWTRAAGSTGRHNVREDHKLFYSGTATTGPINFSVSASAGTYHYYCEFHGSATGGMDGVVKVRPTFNANPTGNPFTVILGPDGHQHGQSVRRPLPGRHRRHLEDVEERRHLALWRLRPERRARGREPGPHLPVPGPLAEDPDAAKRLLADPDGHHLSQRGPRSRAKARSWSRSSKWSSARPAP